MALTNSFLYDIDRIEDLFFPRFTSKKNYISNIKLDMKETETEYVIVADIPGVDKSKINVNYDNNNLTISTERCDEKNENNDHYHYSERCFGSYTRSISLPKNIDYDNMKAIYKDGVLTINAPKSSISIKRTLSIQ